MNLERGILCLEKIWNYGYSHQFPIVKLEEIITEELGTLNVNRVRTVIKGMIAIGWIIKVSKFTCQFTKKGVETIGKDTPKDILSKEEQELFK